MTNKKRAAIGILPSLLTLSNLLCGFLSIAYVADWLGNPADTSPMYWAAALLFLAMVFDALDGKVARMTNSTSDFGGELDSLADMVTFGLAPAFIIRALLQQAGYMPKLAWGVAALYVACCALRLARFNVENSHDEESHESFKGLPSPAAAGAVGSLVMLYFSLDQPPAWIMSVLPVWGVLLAALMISNVPHVHMGAVLLKGKRSFQEIGQVVFAVFGLVMLRELALALIFTAFAMSGLAGLLVRIPARRREAAMGNRAA